MRSYYARTVLRLVRVIGNKRNKSRVFDEFSAGGREYWANKGPAIKLDRIVYFFQDILSHKVKAPLFNTVA